MSPLRRFAVPAGLAALLGLLPGIARAENGPWIAVGLLGGATRPDADLADYQWDRGGKFAWGVQGMLGSGRWGAGIRLWQWSTSQSTGLLGTDPSVSLRSVQLVGEVRPFSLLGVQLIGFVGAGRVHVSYSPDRMTLELPGSEPVPVSFEPVSTWILGLGGGVERPLGRGVAVGLELERSRFSLETSHRVGNTIEEGRETFNTWNLRFRLSWALRT